MIRIFSHEFTFFVVNNHFPLDKIIRVTLYMMNEYALRQQRWRKNLRSSEENRMAAKKKAKKKR